MRYGDPLFVCAMLSPFVLRLVVLAFLIPELRREKQTVRGELVPTLLLFSIYACSGLLSRGGGSCTLGPGSAYKPILVIGGTLMATTCIVARTLPGFARRYRLNDAMIVICILAMTALWMLTSGIHKDPGNPFNCPVSPLEPMKVQLILLCYAVTLITTIGDLRFLMKRLEGPKG